MKTVHITNKPDKHTLYLYIETAVGNVSDAVEATVFEEQFAPQHNVLHHKDLRADARVLANAYANALRGLRALDGDAVADCTLHFEHRHAIDTLGLCFVSACMAAHSHTLALLVLSNSGSVTVQSARDSLLAIVRSAEEGRLALCSNAIDAL